MGMETERPTVDEQEQNAPDHHFKKVIKGGDIDVTQALHEINHNILGHIATLVWLGEDKGNKYRQLCIVPRQDDLYLNYDGRIIHKEKGFDESITVLRRDNLIFPSNGSVFKMQSGVRCFFNSVDPRLCNKNYALDVHNTSIILDNISIYDKHYLSGCMINLRASFEGTLSDPINCNVHVLCSIDEID